ncbi:MAG: MOSC domain-containing protein [Nitrospirota bacterium]
MDQEKKDPQVISLNISPGGIPKRPIDIAFVTQTGIEGDGHEHANHLKPTRAISLFDFEILETLIAEGYPVFPGAMGENITVRDLHVQTLAPKTRLSFSGGVVLELVEPRKPCFVLGAIDARLEKETVGRIGYLALVVTVGTIRVGETIAVSPPAT